MLLKPLLYDIYTNEEDEPHSLDAIKKIIIPSNAIEKYPSVQSFYEEDQLHIQKSGLNNATFQKKTKLKLKKKLSSSIISLKK